MPSSAKHRAPGIQRGRGPRAPREALPWSREPLSPVGDMLPEPITVPLILNSGHWTFCEARFTPVCAQALKGIQAAGRPGTDRAPRAAPHSTEGVQGGASLLPSVARIPQAAQTMRQGPTASMLLSTDLGEMKIPEPMMVPTMMQMPLNRPSSGVEKGRGELVLPPSGAQEVQTQPSSSLPPSHSGCGQGSPQRPRHLHPVLLQGEHQGAAPGASLVSQLILTTAS